MWPTLLIALRLSCDGHQPARSPLSHTDPTGLHWVGVHKVGRQHPSVCMGPQDYGFKM